MTAPDPAVEWRVAWRRSHWSSNTRSKSRRFAHRADADRFARRLADDPRATVQVGQAEPITSAAVAPRQPDVEWRVQWRRQSWSANTRTRSRRFLHRAALDRFVNERLLGADRPDLAPLSLLRITWRHVGQWQNGRPG